MLPIGVPSGLPNGRYHFHVPVGDTDVRTYAFGEFSVEGGIPRITKYVGPTEPTIFKDEFNCAPFQKYEIDGVDASNKKLIYKGCIGKVEVSIRLPFSPHWLGLPESDMDDIVRICGSTALRALDRRVQFGSWHLTG
jgi:hypothetical protein